MPRSDPNGKSVSAQMPNDAAAEKAGSAEYDDRAIVRCHHDSNSPIDVGSNDPPSVSNFFFAGAPGSTAATPSGLMLKAKKINGSSPGLPHWCTRAYGS